MNNLLFIFCPIYKIYKSHELGNCMGVTVALRRELMAKDTLCFLVTTFLLSFLWVESTPSWHFATQSDEVNINFFSFNEEHYGLVDQILFVMVTQLSQDEIGPQI